MPEQQIAKARTDKGPYIPTMAEALAKVEGSEAPEPPVPAPKPAPAPVLVGVWMWAPGHGKDGCHIGLTNGHTFKIPDDPAGVAVPAMFRKEAIAKGCIPVGMYPEQEEGLGFNRAGLIKSKMKEMLEGDDPAFFGADGRPSISKLCNLCGFTVERAERDKLWKQVEDEATGERDEDD